MPTDRHPEARAADDRFVTRMLWLATAGAILLLGACAPDRQGGTAKYPDRWEYRQGPSDNHGKIYRY